MLRWREIFFGMGFSGAWYCIFDEKMHKGENKDDRKMQCQYSYVFFNTKEMRICDRIWTIVMSIENMSGSWWDRVKKIGRYRNDVDNENNGIAS